MAAFPVLSDEQWAKLEPLLPPTHSGKRGRPWAPHRPTVEGVIYRLKNGLPWRCLPREFGAWQTVARRHLQWSKDGTWDRVLAQLQADADANGDLDWAVSVDSTIARVHQHGATAARSTSSPSSYTGGSVE